jgi:ATP-dependent Clp protease protease subunit
MSHEEDDREERREEIKTILELASAFHDRGLMVPTRTIYLGSKEVDAKMASTFIKNVALLEGLGADPITVIMNNPGGDVYHGLAIYDAIQRSKCEIKVIVRGYAMSMGSIILQAASDRVMGPNAVQMIHYGTESLSHHSKVVERQAEESKRINDWMEQMYLKRIQEKRPDFTIGELREMLSFDKYLTAQQSVDLGLADSIG